MNTYQVEIQYDTGFCYQVVISTSDDKYYAEMVAKAKGRVAAQQKGLSANRVIKSHVQEIK